MNHRLDIHSSLFDANQTQLNVTKRNEISIEHENALN
jgi:hypothetical protein